MTITDEQADNGRPEETELGSGLAPAGPAPSSEPPVGRRPGERATNPRTAALVAGASYVALFALGIFANFFVREGLIVDGDAQASAANITESIGLFRLGMISFLVIFLLDVIVAWALHVVFRDDDPDLSRLAAWFRLVYTVFLGVAIIFFYQALRYLDGAAFLDVFTTEQRNAEALVALEAFNSTWLIGLAAFGFHVVLLGLLVLRSGAAPRALGAVLVVAGLAYAIDTSAHTLLPDYGDHEAAFTTMVAVPAVIAEGWFGLWLLLRGGRTRR